MIEKKIHTRRPCSTTEMIKRLLMSNIVKKPKIVTGLESYSWTKPSRSRTMKISLSFDLACFIRMDSL